MGIPFIGSDGLTTESGGAAALATVFFYGRMCTAHSLAVGMPVPGLPDQRRPPLCHSFWPTTADEGLFCLLTGREERRLGRATTSPMPVFVVAVTVWLWCWGVSSRAGALAGVPGESFA